MSIIEIIREVNGVGDEHYIIKRVTNVIVPVRGFLEFLIYGTSGRPAQRTEWFRYDNLFTEIGPMPKRFNTLKDAQDAIKRFKGAVLDHQESLRAEKIVYREVVDREYIE